MILQDSFQLSRRQFSERICQNLRLVLDQFVSFQNEPVPVGAGISSEPILKCQEVLGIIS